MTVNVVKASRRARRYDKERGCYVYDVSFTAAAPLTERTLEVAEAFGLGLDEEQLHVLYSGFEVKLAPGDVVYVTGESGSGKSVLLKAFRLDLGDEAQSLDELVVPSDRPIVDLVGGSFKESLGLLSRVGLNDAFLFLRRPSHLSAGQLYRFRVAQLVDAGKPYWLCDEFCSTLDRTTARVVAFNLQKMARRCGATLIVATTHTDLADDLGPSVRIHKGWGDEVDIEYIKDPEPAECTVARGVTVEECAAEEYKRLSHLHYRGSRVVAPHRFYSMKHGDDLVGVIAYVYPGINATGRSTAAGYRPSLGEVNRDWTQVSRIIVHPRYRGIGLGARLLRETLTRVDRRHVELIAVMAQYNPFAERAGMRLVTLTEPHRSVTETIEALKRLGFNPPLLASRSYCERNIKGLGKDGLTALRDVLQGVSSQYYRRLARVKKPYLKKEQFKHWVEEQDPASLAWTLQTLSILSQSKAYLYWCSDWTHGTAENSAPNNQSLVTRDEEDEALHLHT